MESSPEFFHAAEDYKNGEHFIIDELLDFPNDETMMAAADGGLEAAMTGSSTDSSTLTAADTSCNSSFSTGDPSFGHTSAAGEDFSGGDLCVPYEYDELEHMELLSNIVNESFPSEDLQKLHLIQGMKPTRPEEPGSEPHLYQFGRELTRPAPMIRPELSVPAKARSKRSRAAPGNWTSRLLAVSPSPSAAASTSAEADVPAKKPLAKSAAAQRKKEASGAGATTGAATGGGGGGEGRRCLHCATDKTPQWRTGPMGPKTLCNACGVRYKSGRLVPEYRPAASPTFVLTKHSNSHRKVLELRRQKEMMRVQHHHHHHHHHHQQFLHHHQPSMMFDVSNGGEDYLIHQHIGQDFRQLI